MDLPSDLAAIREKYTALREAQRALNKKLVTMLPKQAAKECAQKLGFWQGGGIAVDDEDHFGVLTDYAIYDYRLRGGTNAVERLFKQKTVKAGTPEYDVLEAMQSARFTALRIVEVVTGTGTVVDDLMYGGQHLLVDLVLSNNTKAGITMGTRVLRFPEFIMTTGASFHVDPEPVEKIVTLLRKESPRGVLEVRDLVEKDKSWLAAVIIRGALAPDDDEDDSYE